jgi:pimeloyl-ACP methyl ester carboxylesterase
MNQTRNVSCMTANPQTPPWVMRRQLAHIPGVQFIVLPEAAHSINWKQLEAFNRNVLEFIRAYWLTGVRRLSF